MAAEVPVNPFLNTYSFFSPEVTTFLNLTFIITIHFFIYLCYELNCGHSPRQICVSPNPCLPQPTPWKCDLIWK